MLGFKHRLLLSHLAIVLLGAGALGAWLYRSAETRLLDSANQRLLDTARLVAEGLDVAELDALRGAPAAAAPTVQNRLRDALAANSQLAVAFVAVQDDAAPRWLAASSPEELAAHDGAHFAANAEQVALLRDSRRGALVRQVSEGEDHGLEALVPVGQAGLYAVGARLKPGVVEEDLRVLRLSTFGAFLVCMLVALVLARVLSQRLHRRIDILVARCRALANGDRVDPADIGRIAERDRIAGHRLRQRAHRNPALRARLRAAADRHRIDVLRIGALADR